MRKKYAFTLIEVFIVVMVVMILTSVSFFGYERRQRESMLQKEVNLFVSKVEEVKERAIAIQPIPGSPTLLPEGGYGIYLEQSNPHSYVIFADRDKDKNYDENEIVERVSLENNVVVKNLPFFWVTIVFRPPSPIVEINTSEGQIMGQEIVFDLGFENTNLQKSIHINKAGLIYVE